MPSRAGVTTSAAGEDAGATSQATRAATGPRRPYPVAPVHAFRGTPPLRPVSRPRQRHGIAHAKHVVKGKPLCIRSVIPQLDSARRP